MRGTAAKQHRATAHAGATKAVTAVAPAIQALAHNDELTRGRVDELERRTAGLEQIGQRTLTGRLRWLLTGK